VPKQNTTKPPTGKKKIDSRTRQPSDTRNLILDAAEEIVLERGGRALKLESAAQTAKLSKGGVLYHFPTKAKLIQGMLARLLDRFEVELQAMAENDSSAEQLSAYISASFHTEERDKRMGAALLAVIAEDKTLMEPLSEFYRRRFEGLRTSDLDFNSAAVAMLAVEGLFLLDLLELSYLSKKERAMLEQELLALVCQHTGEDNSA